MAILIVIWKFIGLDYKSYLWIYVSFESRLFNYKQLLNEVENHNPDEHLHGRPDNPMKNADLGR